MTKINIFKLLFIGNFFLILNSCCLPNISDDENEIDTSEFEDTLISEEIIIDYKSEEQLLRFDTNNDGLPAPLSYRAELEKVSGEEAINYSGLDSMFKNGTDVNEVFSNVLTSKKFVSYLPLVKDRYRSHTVKFKAIEYALGQFSIFNSDKTKCFNLIHFLLSRGVNPNKDGKSDFYKVVERSRSFGEIDSYTCNLIDLYIAYDFDMVTFDLSASGGDKKAIDYLIGKGCVNYDMNTFKFESNVREFYDQKDSLMEKGVVFDFSNIDGDTFPFSSDTTCLILLLEMGLSPYHKTPSGRNLRSDFSHFPRKDLRRVLDKYRKDHPDQK